MRVVTFDAQIALAGARQLLPIGGVMYRMFTDFAAQPFEVRVAVTLPAVRAPLTELRPTDPSLIERRAQCRGDVTAHLGLTVLDAFGQHDGPERFGTTRVVRR
ncbi:Uncharacterised protein [Mycobacteroides abscessus subsp. massiliense]|nr:Uncharacterised protein [Mycobacteroides abscessus subsp. massiliense]